MDADFYKKGYPEFWVIDHVSQKIKKGVLPLRVEYEAAVLASWMMLADDCTRGNSQKTNVDEIVGLYQTML